MQRYAIVDTKTSQVVNLIEYDQSPSNPPPGFDDGVIAVQHDRADPSWSWSAGALVEPAEVVGPFDAKLAAQAALNVSDMVALRCFKAGVAYPAEWVSYTAALRNLVRTGTGDLPPPPSYPAGT